MENGKWLEVEIQEDAEVDRAVAELDNPHSKFTRFIFTEEESARVIGDEGNLAMHDKIAPALERAKRSNEEGIYVYFYYCNLDDQAVLRLASAVEKSTCIGKINCMLNPGNNELTEGAMEEAIIATKSPIEVWNGDELSADIVKARREREAKEKMKEEERKAFLSSLSTRVPTRNEFDLAQRESQSIMPQITSKKEELKAGLEKLAREEAEEKALKERLQELENKIGASRSGNDKIKAEVDELAKKLEPHEAVIKRVQELKNMFAKVDPPASPPQKQAQQQQDEADRCRSCTWVKANALLLCGHRVCKPCGDGMLAEKSCCPKCSKPVTGVIPIL